VRPGVSAHDVQARPSARAARRMRVIAGTRGGRRLLAPRGSATRPTADRVREALFSMLGEVQGVRVLDLFAGTGALGIEALSRGAACAVFVECERTALSALRANLAALRLDPPLAEVRPGDALRTLQSACEAGERYDLVFLDPPYARSQEWGLKLRERLPQALAPEGRVVVESDRRAPLLLELPVQRQRRYGDTSITIHGQR
jgi:16S rRNA (guanine966-N2)-methyltransferase